MFEIIAAAFETPELASTNILSLVTLVLSVATAADAHIWVRTREAAKRVTVTVITKGTRRATQEIETQPVVREISPAAHRLHRNAARTRY